MSVTSTAGDTMNARELQGQVVGAIQPGYLPWLGFFEQADRVNIFLLFDDLQYTRYDWRNRNRIKGPAGPIWLIVPVIRKFGQHINEARIDNSRNWAKRHWLTICQCYGKAPYFEQHRRFFQELYHSQWDQLCELNITVIRYVMEQMKIRTRLIRSSELALEERFRVLPGSQDRKNERIVFFMKEVGGSVLYSGEKSESYINLALLGQHSIHVRFQHYRHPVYPQLHGAFIPYLSIIDLLFNCGDESLDILKSDGELIPQ
jgi:hypothetical protein